MPSHRRKPKGMLSSFDLNESPRGWDSPRSESLLSKQADHLQRGWRAERMESLGHRPRARSEPSCGGLLVGLIIFGFLIFSQSHTSLSSVINGLGIHVDPRIPIVIVELVAFLLVYVVYRRMRAGRIGARQTRQAQIEERLRLSSLALMRLTPAEFEQEVAWVVGTYTKGATTEVVGGSGDGGIDINVYNDSHKLVGVVQVKHRTNPNEAIEPKEVQAMDSIKQRMELEHAWVVTNARFSGSTMDLGKRYGILLIDGVHFEKARRKAYARWYASYYDASRPAPAQPPTFAAERASASTPTTPPQPGPGKPPAPTPSAPLNPLDPVDQQLRDRRRRLGLE